MRDYALFHAERLERIGPFPVLRRLISNWRRRRRLYELQHLDDHALADIGLTRADVAAVLGQPLSVDPVWDLERRARLGRIPPLSDATARWLHDSAYTHPRLDRPR